MKKDTASDQKNQAISIIMGFASEFTNSKTTVVHDIIRVDILPYVIT